MMEKLVRGIMTCPRYSNTYSRNYIDKAFKELGIPLQISLGVFYGQCMQRMLEEALRDGVELIVTVDFDSVFSKDHIMRLINMISAHDEIDALASLQARRGMPYPLFTAGKSEAVQFEGKPLQVTTAHFGLTVLDLSKLGSVQKPWFVGKPDENGEWGDDRIDDDIWFWQQWTNAGNSIFVDSGCSIGHLEEVMACFDNEGKHQFVYPSEWIKENVK